MVPVIGPFGVTITKQGLLDSNDATFTSPGILRLIEQVPRNMPRR